MKAFQELSAAHEILVDPEKRKIYDKYGENGLTQTPVSAAYGDIFSNIFNIFTNQGFGMSQNNYDDDRGFDMPGKGCNIFENMFKAHHHMHRESYKVNAISTSLQITLENSYFGSKMPISIIRQKKCVDCGSENVCQLCKGRGLLTSIITNGFSQISLATTCKGCNGQGKFSATNRNCKRCKGSYYYNENKQIEVNITKGIANEESITLAGQGNEREGAMAGDIIIKIYIKPHHQLQREGDDLTFTKKVTLFEALSGMSFLYSHIDRKEYHIKASPQQLVQPGSVKTIIGLGMPIGGTAKYGNLFITFDVELPDISKLNPTTLDQLSFALSLDEASNNNTQFDPKLRVHQLQEYNETQENISYGMIGKDSSSDEGLLSDDENIE